MATISFLCHLSTEHHYDRFSTLKFTVNLNIFKKFDFFLKFILCEQVFFPACMSDWSPRRLEEGIKSPGVGFADGCEPLRGL